MKFSVRPDVFLTPLVPKPTGMHGLATTGIIGAWSGSVPVSEAMDFALGRQCYVFRPGPPDRVDVKHHAGRAVYLGPPHSSFGHFLTQGLARAWYALLHPDLPVVWDARALLPYQREVLRAIGMDNSEVFLTEPMTFDEVVFPHPGICLGDFALSEHMTLIGRCSPSQITPGRKLFLSRSALGNSRGSLGSGLDAELDSLVARHGFEVFHPQQHSLSTQLAEISSAETVLAVEGSALHLPILLRGPVETRFWALTRHRHGGGAFAHIRTAKRLNYRTLNFLKTPATAARSSVEMDLKALDKALDRTDGLTCRLEEVEERLEKPYEGQASYEALLDTCQVFPSAVERKLIEAFIALRLADPGGAIGLIDEALRQAGA